MHLKLAGCLSPSVTAWVITKSDRRYDTAVRQQVHALPPPGFCLEGVYCFWQRGEP